MLGSRGPLCLYRTVLGGQAIRASLAAVAVVALVGCGADQAPRGEDDGRPAPGQSLVTQAPPEVTEAPQKHPNVMVIEADDMRWDDMRWMPNVHHLIQRRGLSFENSFAPYPLCCPSRASFLTGQYAHNHHVYSHVDPFGFQSFKDKRTIATVLQKAGYRTALVGKYLNGYGEQPVNGTSDSSLNYVPPGWSQWMAGSDHLWRPGDPFRGGTYDYFSLVQNINGRIVGSPGRYSTDVLAEQARRLADRFGRQPKPWFIWWTPVAPHHGSPVESDDPPVSRRTDGLDTRWVTPPAPTGSRVASTVGSPTAPATPAPRDRPRRTSPTSRATCASSPSSRRPSATPRPR